MLIYLIFCCFKGKKLIYSLLDNSLRCIDEFFSLNFVSLRYVLFELRISLFSAFAVGQLSGLTGSLSTVNTLYTSAREESLRSDLFGSYQKNSRPAPISDIRCNIKLLSIKDLVSACRTYKCAKFDFLNGFINEYLVFF